MSKKSLKIANLIEACQGYEQPAHYLGYFECFNRGMFYEAHDVLEELWLPQRRGADGDFYKGLIQFAGAFVHLQKNRLQPAGALFKLARANLEKYRARHLDLEVDRLLETLAAWLGQLEEGGYRINPLATGPAPKLGLALAPRSLAWA